MKSMKLKGFSNCAASGGVINPILQPVAAKFCNPWLQNYSSQRLENSNTHKSTLVERLAGRYLKRPFFPRRGNGGYRILEGLLK